MAGGGATSEEPAFQSERAAWLAAFGAVFALAAWLRVDGAGSRGLEYDEIWTLTHYAGQDLATIFSDLATPNNHPLHSLAVKLFGGGSFLNLRLPALLAGLCVPLLTALFVWRLLKDKAAALLAFAFCAFNGGLIHYSQTARGYSMQTLFVLLAAFALFALDESRWRRWLQPSLFFLASAAAILTVSSGIIFIAPLCLVWLLRAIDFKKLGLSLRKETPSLLAFCAFGALCLLWYGANYAKFRAGQSFGESIGGPSAFALFFWDRLLELAGAGAFFAFLPLLAKETRKLGWLSAGAVALPLFAALATKAGPARVYLPLLPFMALGAALCLKAILLRMRKGGGVMKKLCFGLLLAALALDALPSKAHWTPTDWSAAVPQLIKELPQDALVCYPSADSYPIMFNCGQLAIPDNFERLRNFKGELFQVAAPGRISALNIASGGQIELPARAARAFLAAGLAVEAFRFRQLRGDDKIERKTILSIFGPVDEKNYHDLTNRFFATYSWRMLNCNLTTKEMIRDGKPALAAAFMTNECEVPASGLLELAELSGGAVRFFILEEPAK